VTGAAEVSIAEFEASDQGAVRELILDGLEEHWGQLDAGLNPDVDDLARAYKDGTVLVARVAGRIVGAGVVVPLHGDAVGEVKRMSVARDLRRSGVATALLEEMVAIAVRRGWRALVLETTATWTDAVALYERFGFELTHYEDGEFGRDVHFRLDLAHTP
jgi:ribosomal protein S18 acetylase RimI-like enzyme